jgi:hypothetical protein
VTDTGKEQIAADAPNQQPGESECLGMAPDVTIGLGPRQLAKHRTLWMACSIDQHQ